PALLHGYGEPIPAGRANGGRKVVLGLAVAAAAIGIFMSWFASANPDGLEWAMERTSGGAELEAEGRAHEAAAGIQSATAFLPDYGFRPSSAEGATAVTGDDATAAQDETEGTAEAWPSVNAGTSLSGVVGGAMALGLSALAGLAVFAARRKGERSRSA
ncbi:MAG: PDGLE domain-containing protein, partial [Spirochaetes bacterium]|nr:PDGLE domain-containing protein [Spirochaetota bacterium]